MGAEGQPEPTIVDPGTAPAAVVAGTPPPPAQPKPPAQPAAGAPTAATPAPAEIPLNEQFEWDEASGTDSATLQELIDARRVLRTYGEDFQLFRKAVSGDPAAIQAIVAKSTAGRQVPGAAGVTPVAPQTPPAAPPATPPAGVSQAEWEQVRSWVERARTTQTRQGIAEFLKSKPEYHSLSLRPDAVDKVIVELNRVFEETKAPVTPQVLENVVRFLNNIEVEYLKRVKAEDQSQAGELGLSDLFRGGSPHTPERQRPDFRKDPAGYKKYLADRALEAIQSARESGAV